MFLAVCPTHNLDHIEQMQMFVNGLRLKKCNNIIQDEKKDQHDINFKKFLEIFKKLEIKIPFSEVLEQMFIYAKYWYECDDEDDEREKRRKWSYIKNIMSWHFIL